MSVAVVLGGGVSGLAAAYFLRKLAKHVFDKVILLEASPRVGGWVQSTHLPNGAIYELGPRSLRPVGIVGANTLKLAEDLGLSDDIISVKRGHPASRNRFIYVNQKLHPLPTGALGTLVKTAPFSKPLISFIMKEAFMKRQIKEDETVHEFISRRFGNELAQYAVDPLMRGVYAGNSKDLSAKSCLADIFRYEQDYGSVVRGMIQDRGKGKAEECQLVEKAKKEKWASWSLINGLQQLTDTLQENILTEGVEVHTSLPCDQLTFVEGKVKVKTAEKEFMADHVFSSVYSKDLAEIVPTNHSQLCTDLSQIPAVTVAVVNMEFYGNKLKNQGFGHLLPSSESEGILGIVYDSCAFPQHNAKAQATTRLTCMLGGAWFSNVFGDPDSVKFEDLIRTAVQAARTQLGVTENPFSVGVAVHKNCIPQYMVGHSQLVNRILAYISDHKLPLSILGSSYKGASVNDCIYNAKLAVENMI